MGDERAGSPQGEGRPRPGRPDSELSDPFPDDGVPDHTDHDPPPGRHPAPDGRRVDGDRAQHLPPPTANPDPTDPNPADPDPPSRELEADHDHDHDGHHDHDDHDGAATTGDTGVRDVWRARTARHVPAPVGLHDRSAVAPSPTGAGFQPLPFGSGLVLIGLGLGFLGIRLRRA